MNDQSNDNIKIHLKKYLMIFKVNLSANWIFLISLAILVGKSHPENNFQRIISLAPHITEIIYGIGAGDCLVGRTDFCEYPPRALEVESIGGYLNIDYEKVVRLQPDIILQFPNEENKRKLTHLGFMVHDIPNETISDIISGILKIGKLLNFEDRANQYTQNIKDTLKMVGDRAHLLVDSCSAILVVGRQQGSLSGLYLAGNDTYLSQIWKICGGKNAFSDIPLRYFSINQEDLIKTAIDIVLEFHPNWMLDGEETENEIKVWNVFRNLSAVRENEIYIFSDKFYVIPGPRISRIAIVFSQIIQNFQSH
jgi:iron complex transport system substrate-binding protein